MDAVRTMERLRPGAQQIALGVEYRYRMLAAIKGINPVLPVDADCSAVAEVTFSASKFHERLKVYPPLPSHPAMRPLLIISPFEPG